MNCPLKLLGFRPPQNAADSVTVVFGLGRWVGGAPIFAKALLRRRQRFLQ